MKSFIERCCPGQFTPKFYLLDHIVEDLRILGTLSVFDASLFEQCKVNIKQAYKRALLRSDTFMYENVHRVDRQQDNSEFLVKTHISETENKAEASKKNEFCKTGHFLCAIS